MSETNPIDIAAIVESDASFDEKVERFTTYQRAATYAEGLTAAQLVRDYPSISPELAAGIAKSGLPADSPLIQQVIEVDNQQKSSGAWGVLEAAGRFGMGIAHDIWDNGLPRDIRTALNLASGDGLLEAYTTSGQTLPAAAIEDWRVTGQAPTFDRVFGSSGFMPGDGSDPALHPGSSDVLQGYMSQGFDPATAMEYTRAYQTQNDSGSLFDKSRRLQESTILHNTLGDGTRVAYHATPARALWWPALRTTDPDSFLYNQVTGWTDAALQVTADPLNPAFDYITDAVRASRTAVRAGDLTAKETADAMARSYGGIRIDPDDAAQNYPVAFHGTMVDELEGGVINAGGLTSRYDEARGFATQGGRGTVHVVDPENLPDSLKNIYRDADGNGYQSIEQIIPEEAAWEVFPDMAPGDIILEARRYSEAKRYMDSDEIFNTFANRGDAEKEMVDFFYASFDPQYADDIGLEIDYDLFATPQDVRAAVAEWDDADELVAALDRYIEADDIVRNSPLATDDLTPEQLALIQRIGILENGREFVFGTVDEAITPSASFSIDELEQMESLGYVFTSRQGWEDYQQFLAEGAEMGAHVARGKPFVNPQTWERWSETRKGGRMFDWVAENTIIDIRKRFPGMTQEQLWALHYAKTPEQAKAIIKQWYGSPQSGYRVPRRSGAAAAAEDARRFVQGAAPGKIQSTVFPAIETLSVYGRRLAAEVGHSKIDPYDAHATWEYVENAGKTLGRSNDEIEDAMKWLNPAEIKLDEAGKPIKNMRDRGKAMQEQIYGWLHSELATKFDDEYATYVIEQWRKAESKNRVYAENAAGKPLDLQRATGRRLRNGDNETLDLIDGGEPILDSQLAQRHMFMPSIRELRRVTAGIRTATEKARMARGKGVKNAVGIADSRFNKVVDGYLASWRNLALLRIGWMMRVIPDELGRMYVSGYNDVATSPLAYIAYSAGRKGNQLTADTALHQITEAMGLGADNGLFRSLDNQAYLETNLRGASWNQVKATFDGVTLTTEGANGISRRMLQLNQSQLTDLLYDYPNIDDLVRYLRDDPEGMEILRGIWGSAEDGTQLHRAASFGADGEKQLRVVLESLEAQRHQYTGGAWVGKSSAGGWVDMYGAPVQTYMDFDKTELQNLARDRGLTVRGSKNDIRARLLEQDGLPPDLNTRPESYVVTKQGIPELLDIIRTGRMQGVPSRPRAKVNAARDWFKANYGTKTKRSEYLYVVKPEGQVLEDYIASGNAQIWQSFEEAARRTEGLYEIMPIEIESVPPSLLSRKFNGNGSLPLLAEDAKHMKLGKEGPLSGDELSRLADEAMEEGTIPLVFDDMTKDDFDSFNEFLTNAYTADNPPVRKVHAPDKPYVDFDDERTLIDAMYEIIGKNPTLFGVRRPYATLRTWEVMAGHYIGAAPDVRRAIMANAEKAGVLDRFTSFVDDALRRQNLTAPTARHSMDVDEIVKLSWGEAIDDTKDLFYDLAKGGNWQDASRFVFPFADAWWEVLSRWARLANPAVTGGQPLRAAKRMTTMALAAESSGYFTENGDGQRVFEIPGTATMFNLINANSPVQLGGQVTMDQLTFVDFGAPSQALKPGFTPQVQLAAGFTRNMLFDNGTLPETFRDNYDKFFFGDFAPPAGQITNLQENIELFLPTWMRRTISRVWQGDFDDDYAALTVRYANGWAAAIGEEASTNQDLARLIVSRAQEQASQVATIDIFSAFVSPAQPRKVAEVLLVDEQGTEYVKSIAALATDFRYMKDIYGPQAAVEMFDQAYGFDPLKLAPTYWSDERRPVTNDAWEYMIANPEIDEHARFTIMAWIPEFEGDEFNIDAWRAAEYEKLEGKDAAEYWSYAAGAHRLQAIRSARDEVLRDLEERYGSTKSAGYKYMNEQVVQPWYKQERANIATQYYGYDPGEGLAGVSNRPSYRRVWNELSNIGTPGTEANLALKSVDPELVSFTELAVASWNKATELGLEAGFGHEWWQTSEAENGIARAIREWYSGTLSTRAGQMNPTSRAKAEYIGQYFLAPLLTGFDWDNPVVVAPSTPSTEQLGYADQLGGRGDG